MAAVTICSHPRHRAPARLVASRQPARPHPSAAVRRRRAAITLVILAAIGILLGAGSLAGAEQVPTSKSTPRVHLDTTAVASATHVVQPGDTLWSVARRIQPEGDVRPLVARLRAAHGPGPLLPGQPLRIAV